jgi:hypothetical protein
MMVGFLALSISLWMVSTGYIPLNVQYLADLFKHLGYKFQISVRDHLLRQSYKREDVFQIYRIEQRAIWWATSSPSVVHIGFSLSLSGLPFINHNMP